MTAEFIFEKAALLAKTAASFSTQKPEGFSNYTPTNTMDSRKKAIQGIKDEGPTFMQKFKHKIKKTGPGKMGLVGLAGGALLGAGGMALANRRSSNNQQ